MADNNQQTEAELNTKVSSKPASLEDLLKQGAPQAQKEQAKAKEEVINAEADDIKKVVVSDAAIVNNPVAEVMLNPNLTNEEKEAELAKLFTYNDNVSEDKLVNAKGEPISEVQYNQDLQVQQENFKAWLNQTRVAMAQDIALLTNKETYAELHKMFQQIHTEQLAYYQQLEPLQDIVAAVDLVLAQGEGTMIQVYASIKEDEIKKAEYAKNLANADALLKSLSAKYENYSKDILLQQTEKTLFRKNIKKKAAQKIIEIEDEQRKLGPEILKAKAKFDDLTANPYVAKFEDTPDMKKAKEKLRELNDISSEEWKERVEGLVNTAVRFIQTTDARGQAALKHSLDRREHIAALDTARSNMGEIYAIFGAAEKKAEENNKALRVKYTKTEEEEATEDLTEGLLRKRTLSGVSQFMEKAQLLSEDTETVSGELVRQGVSLTAARKNNETSISRGHTVVGSTNAAVSESLAMALDNLVASATDSAMSICEEANNEVFKKNGIMLKSAIERTARNSKEAANKMRASREEINKVVEMGRKALEATAEGQRQRTEEAALLEEAHASAGKMLEDYQGASAAGSKTPEFNKKAATPDAAKPAANTNEPGKAFDPKNALTGFVSKTAKPKAP